MHSYLPCRTFRKTHASFLKRPLSVNEVKTWSVQQPPWAFKCKFSLCTVRQCGRGCFIKKSNRLGKYRPVLLQCNRSMKHCCSGGDYHWSQNQCRVKRL